MNPNGIQLSRLDSFWILCGCIFFCSIKMHPNNIQKWIQTT